MSGARPDLGPALAEVVGPAHVVTGGPAAAYTVDDATPRWVVFPGTLEELARCLALAHAEGLAVAPAGAGTRLSWGGRPARLDLVVSLRRLDRVLQHEPADLTLAVEAGMPLGRLNGILAAERQRLPLDPPQARRSTLGGLIATNASGPYRTRYGTLRELVLGLTVVQADGTVLRIGGRVVKNATGYDLPRLHVGALGTLGVVAAANLRLHPVPEVETTWVFGFPTVEAAVDGALAVLDAPVVPSRLQLLDAGALGAAGLGGAVPAALAVSVGSVPEAVRAQGVRIETLCRQAGAMLLAPPPDPEAFWLRVSEAAWPADPQAEVVLRVGVRSTDLPWALREVQAAAGDGRLVRATAEVADGVLHPVLTGLPGTRLAAMVGRVRERLAAVGGTCLVEHAPAAAKDGLDVWGDPGAALALMRGLKAELDPRGILNPGRFVGGI